MVGSRDTMLDSSLLRHLLWGPEPCHGGGCLYCSSHLSSVSATSQMTQTPQHWKDTELKKRRCLCDRPHQIWWAYLLSPYEFSHKETPRKATYENWRGKQCSMPGRVQHCLRERPPHQRLALGYRTTGITSGGEEKTSLGHASSPPLWR